MAATNYLTLASEDDPLDLVTTESIKNAFVAWKLLMDEYEPADKEAIAELEGAYTQLSMVNKENSKTMIMKVTQLNKWIKKVENRYEKDDIKLIIHSLAQLPVAHIPVKVAIQNSGIQNAVLNKVQKGLQGLVALWKELCCEGEQENKKDVTMMADEKEEK